MLNHKIKLSVVLCQPRGEGIRPKERAAQVRKILLVCTHAIPHSLSVRSLLMPQI